MLRGLIWLVGCGGGDGAGDRAVYAEIVADRQPVPERDLPRCLGLADPGLAGDCAMLVAHRAGVTEDRVLHWCAEVPEGAWRDECAFLGAEHLRKRREIDEALDACDEAGGFRTQCQYHLWQDDVHRAVKSVEPGDASNLERRLAGPWFRWEQRLGGRWAPEPGALPPGVPIDGGLEEAFWARGFRGVFEPLDAPDIAACDEVSRLAACEAAVSDVVRRRAIDARHRSGGCPVDWEATRVRYVPDPRLDAVLAEVCP